MTDLTDAKLDREFAYSRQRCVDNTCANPYDLATWCQRFRGHDGPHAAGYGRGRKRWAE